MAVSPDLRIEVSGEAPPVPPALEPAIAAAWEAAQRRAGGRLFNGRVFSVESAEPHLLRGHLAEYRLVVAGFADPALAARLGLRPLAVCGVLRTPDGVLFGRRTPRATYEPGLWQMPPAGSVDASAVREGRVDPLAQIRTEFEEELALPWGVVRRARPFALVRAGSTGVHDLGIVLETEARFATILARQRHARTVEYTALRVVPEAALPAFCAAEGRAMVPAAPLFLAALGLLPGAGVPQ
ncbi:hypothetical protein [Crenalkalicoccus roseus]|uniref:hypothetical protein n=1 Tax=Crenalkalicoccus roseus TaxID=1485588 RepID=UPI0010817071|nr:hypothetical protein [Crenalkalicoccus roseus]